MKLFTKKSSDDTEANSDSSIQKQYDDQNEDVVSVEPNNDEDFSTPVGDERREQLFHDIKKMEFSREAEIFKALGHPIRLKIVYGLLKVGGCNVKNMQECLGLHQATVSQHLIHLKSRGIITSERQGLEMVYTVNNNWAKCVIDNIERNQKDPRFK